MAVRARPDNLSLDEVRVRVAPDEGTEWFAELWGHHQELQSVCLRMVGDPGKAEDVVQETYLRALQQSRRLDRRDSFGPWLATVARRRAIDEIRAQRRNREQPGIVDVRASANVADDPAEHVLQTELFERIRVALGELSTRERQILLRQVTHGLTLAELAEEEATSIASVRSVLSRARVKLRVALEKGGPLGAAPGSGLVAAVRERLQRVATRIEGVMPSLVGSGAHLGDMVGAVIAAAVMLLGGTAVPTPPEGDTFEVAAAQVVGTDIAANPIATSTGTNAGPDAVADAVADSPPPPAQHSLPLATPLPDPLLPNPEGPGAGVIDGPYDEPEQAKIEHLAANEDGSSVFAAGLSMGGIPAIYHSADGGRTWTRLVADQYLGGRLLVPSAYPLQNILFAITPGGALQVSRDGGRTFSLAAPARGVAEMSPGFRSGDQRVLIAMPHLVAYQAASGTTVPLATIPAHTYAVGGMAMLPSFPDDPLVLIGGMSQVTRQATVHRCDAFSCSETVALPATGGPPRIHVSRSGAVFAFGGNVLFRSADQGRTFAQVPLGLPAAFDILGVRDGQEGELLLIGNNSWQTNGSGFLRSLDDGVTWAAIGETAGLQPGGLSILRLPNGHLLVGVLGSRYGLLCSADDGASWSPRCP